MDAELFAESIEYERLSQAVYQAILRTEGQDIEVLHNQDVIGRSGVQHQVDVLWRFTQAGVAHLVLIECKNYSSALTLEKVRNFFAVLHDIGNCRGLMVTRTGFQHGAHEFADFYGIGLKLLRPSKPEDWEGRIKDIKIDLQFRGIVSRADCPLRVGVKLDLNGADEENRYKSLQARGELNLPPTPEMVFWSSDRKQVTEELRWWLPKQLLVAQKEDGGPYQETISLEDHYLLLNAGEKNEIFIKVHSLDIEYYVETLDNREMVILGAELVEAILKDVNSGLVEYVKQKTR